MNNTLSVSEWHQLAAKGSSIPVRIQLGGYSMNPLIRGFRDYVTILPLEEIPEIGDIVLFCEPGTERYVMHRVWSLKDNMVLTWGDNCCKPDTWMPVEHIWGKAVLIEHGKHTVHPDPEKGIRWACFWHRVGKIYRFLRQIRNIIRRRIRRIMKHTV